MFSKKELKLIYDALTHNIPPATKEAQHAKLVDKVIEMINKVEQCTT